jgi:hypothetical protein
MVTDAPTVAHVRPGVRITTSPMYLHG